jgi:hypothetical protein
MKHKLKDTELPALFEKARMGLSLREISRVVLLHNETWRQVEKRIFYEPSPDVLALASTAPGGVTYEELVDALERDRKKIFDRLYRTPQMTAKARRLAPGAHKRYKKIRALQRMEEQARALRAETKNGAGKERSTRRSANGRASRKTTAST